MKSLRKFSVLLVTVFLFSACSSGDTQDTLYFEYGGVEIVNNGYVVDAAVPLVQSPTDNSGRMFIIAEGESLESESPRSFLLAVIPDIDDRNDLIHLSIEEDRENITAGRFGDWDLYVRESTVDETTTGSSLAVGDTYQSFMAVKDNLMVFAEAPYTEDEFGKLLPGITQTGEWVPSGLDLSFVGTFGESYEEQDDGFYTFKVDNAEFMAQGTNVVASTLNGEDLIERHENFHAYIDEVSGTYLVNESGIAVARLEYDWEDGNEPVTYYQLLFKDYDALIISTIELVDSGGLDFTDIDAELITRVNQWKQGGE